MDPGLDSQQSAERLLALTSRGIKLPPLPTISSELLEMARQPLERIDMRRLAGLIERDQALTAAILKLVNSPYYGCTRTIAQVSRALTLIGLGDALSYLNFFLMRSLMPVFPHLPHLTQSSYFQHSWACAAVARQLGRPQYLIQSLPGELYLAGLMHDIGKVVLAVHQSDAFAEALERAHAELRPLAEVEREVLGIDHATLGAHLLDEWNLPSRILDAVAYHHQPELAPPEHRELAGLVELADMIANLAPVGDGGNPCEFSVLDSWTHLHGESRLSDRGTLLALVEDVHLQLRQQAEILDYVDAAEPGPHVQEVLADVPAEGPTDAAASPSASNGHDHAALAMVGAASRGGLWHRFKSRLGSLLRV